LAKSLLIKDVESLSHELLNNTINFIDIDYEVRRPNDNPWSTRTRSIAPEGAYAILNAYRMWLQSKKYDYVRNPSYGGLFEYSLNDRVSFNVDNEEAVANLVREETGKKWPGIVILDIVVKAIITERRWHIKIVCQDRGSKLILTDGNISVPASI